MRHTTQLMVALDVDSLKEARRLVGLLYPRVRIFKVGIQLFTAAGPQIIESIHQRGAEVFLDLKFFDIPNTVGNAVSSAIRLKVRMLSLHISGGSEMLKRAVKSVKQAALLRWRVPLLIGVTELTSRGADPTNILNLAREGLSCGLDGVVCSAQEAALLRKRIKRRFLILTPGIRVGKVVGDDQKRSASIKEAVNSGSDYLILGRPIIRADDPRRVVQQIEEILCR